MRLKCCLCGKLTEPFAFIGAMAVGPRCARKAGITPAKTRKGAAIRFSKPVKREPGPQTLDLFEHLKDDDGNPTTLATEGA
jgi:hypothetical protein